MPNMALRMGELILTRDKWKLSSRCTRELKRTPRALQDDDFDLDIGQKGVDLRIGLDMARLALRELVRTIIVVTADGDFVPAFKFVRREGVKVILDPMGHNPPCGTPRTCGCRAVAQLTSPRPSPRIGATG